MSKQLSKTFITYPNELHCLGCDAVLVKLRHLGDSWSYPCVCPKCKLQHTFDPGGTIETETILYADLDPNTGKLRIPNYRAIQWVALFLSVVGILLNANKNIVCWPIWIASCVAWILYFRLSEKYNGYSQPGAILLNVIFLLSNIYGWIQWSN